MCVCVCVSEIERECTETETETEKQRQREAAVTIEAQVSATVTTGLLQEWPHPLLQHFVSRGQLMSDVHISEHTPRNGGLGQVPAGDRTVLCLFSRPEHEN